MRLTPCPACARHVRSDASVCPFCDCALPSSSSARAKVGAILIGAVTVSSLSGCPRTATKYGGPPLPEPSSDPAADTSAPEADPPDAEAPEQLEPETPA